MSGAVYTTAEDGRITLSATPIIFVGITEGTEVERLAYWPASQEMGVRVLTVLDAQRFQTEEKEYYNNNVFLLDAMWATVQGEILDPRDTTDLYTKHFKVEKSDEIGILRPIVDTNEERSSFKTFEKLKDLSPFARHQILSSLLMNCVGGGKIKCDDVSTPFSHF